MVGVGAAAVFLAVRDGALMTALLSVRWKKAVSQKLLILFRDYYHTYKDAKGADEPPPPSFA